MRVAVRLPDRMTSRASTGPSGTASAWRAEETPYPRLVAYDRAWGLRAGQVLALQRVGQAQVGAQRLDVRAEGLKVRLRVGRPGRGCPAPSPTHAAARLAAPGRSTPHRPPPSRRPDRAALRPALARRPALTGWAGRTGRAGLGLADECEGQSHRCHDGQQRRAGHGQHERAQRAESRELVDLGGLLTRATVMGRVSVDRPWPQASARLRRCTS
jgi:hypothetical protein